MADRDVSVDLIKAGLSTRFIGQNIIYFPRLPSTMETARTEARKGTVDGTVIIAGEQTAGRGRLKRTWLSPGGNIALSLVLRPETAALPYLIMIASLAVASSIESTTGLKPRIKWPNDILIRGKKVAGILIENDVKGKKIAFAVIGIGINVTLRPAEVPEISTTATSIEAEAGKPVHREEIIRDLLIEFERLYLKLPDAEPIYKAWRDRLVTLGQKVTAAWGEERIFGTAESVDKSGALLIRLVDGALTKVVAGDVTLRER